MRKSFLLSVCLLGIYGVSACSNVSNNDEQVFYMDNNNTVSIDATVNPYEKCGANGISCNDTALVNYTKTDANFRAYGERTKRDHLYTKAGTGDNLVATIQPGLEEEKVEEIVIAQNDIKTPKEKKYVVEDGVFSQTETLKLEADPKDYEATTAKKREESGDASKKDAKNEIGLASNIDINDQEIESEIKKVIRKDGSVIETKDIVTKDGSKGEVKKITKKDGTIVRIRKIIESNGDISEIKKVTDKKGEVQELKKTINKDGNVYEVVCEEECEEFFNSEESDDDIIMSEFSEESFDIADYVDDEEVKFENVGEDNKITSNVDIKDIAISDNTVLTWEAEEGDNLRELLTKWSSMAGWKLLWNTNRNYILSAGVMFKGKFADVSSALIRAFARARPAPIATYYKGNRVIVIETMENENAY